MYIPVELLGFEVRYFGVGYWIQVLPIHYRLNVSSCIESTLFTLSYCYFLLLELSLCFTKIVKSGKSSEMSSFEIQVRFSWSLVMFLGVSDDVVNEFPGYFAILEGLFTIATNLCWNTKFTNFHLIGNRLVIIWFWFSINNFCAQSFNITIDYTHIISNTEC